MRVLNLCLTALLILAIAYAILRGLSAQVDAYEIDRAHRIADSVIVELATAKATATAAASTADSLRALIDSADGHHLPDTVYIIHGINSMRYAGATALRDTLLSR